MMRVGGSECQEGLVSGTAGRIAVTVKTLEFMKRGALGTATSSTEDEFKYVVRVMRSANDSSTA